MRCNRSVVLFVVLLFTLPACGALEYDLASVPVPISAKPAAATATVEPFRHQAKNILWVHGLFGQSQPDVAAYLTEVSRGYAGIAGLRISVGAGFHDWLVTHVTGTLVRLKTVVIEGQLVKGTAR